MNGQAIQRLRDRQSMRAAANNIILHLHPTRVPAAALRFTYTWGLGGIAALLTVMLVVTGVLLVFRYEPTVDRAYLSIQALEAQVLFGALIRSIHHWSGNFLVVVAFLHLLRVFFTGGYKQGRAVNWVVGLFLLVLVLVFNFTGYLLPWDQLAYWAATVGTSLLDYIPLVGVTAVAFLRGGPEVGQATLSNFYAIHVAVLPVLLAILLSYHFWRIRKDGGISQPTPPPETTVQKLTTIPHLVQREMAVAVVVITAVTLWAMFIPAPLEELANPLQSPNPAKAAWYFLGLQELLLHLPPRALMALIAVVSAALGLLPYWDRQEETIGHYFQSHTGRRAALAGLLLGLSLPPLLIAADEYWLNLPAWLPAWPTIVTAEAIPLLLTLAGLVVIYFVTRLLLKANHSEGLVGLFTFVMTSLVVLTAVGIFCRGPNMALVLPF
ncbi:MAG: cytochrome b N-terminal domain-containing protein [Ardenticatenaceae bacterium]|nr:cytochrome b N-terminal domain-containing protein [Ardenticatenaceae bacterium]